METLWGAGITALVVVLIPIVGWFSRRATKEGRLTLRVERMGTVYAAMPESDARTAYQAHYVAAISDLNEWLDIDARALRLARRAISIAVYTVGIAVLFVVSWVLRDADATAKVLAGIGIGVGIAVSTFGSGALLERQASRKQLRNLDAERRAAESAKVEAFRKGEPLAKED